jgi:hypothetical protein
VGDDEPLDRLGLAGQARSYPSHVSRRLAHDAIRRTAPLRATARPRHRTAARLRNPRSRHEPHRTRGRTCGRHERLTSQRPGAPTAATTDMRRRRPATRSARQRHVVATAVVARDTDSSMQGHGDPRALARARDRHRKAAAPAPTRTRTPRSNRPHTAHRPRRHAPRQRLANDSRRKRGCALAVEATSLPSEAARPQNRW